MKINQALVVYKQLPPPSLRRKRTRGQDLHLKTLDRLYPLLREFGISFDACSTKQLVPVGKDVDLVITVGGDGTVLQTSHFTGSQPIVGIKSFGPESIGYFCAAMTDTMNLYLRSLFAGHIKPVKLHRLEVTLNGRRVKELALNDILFAHAMPASTTHYKLAIGPRSEIQKSSGIWISTAAGSTAAVSAAGGRPLPLTSPKMEFVVREPYAPSIHFSLVKGIIPNTRPIRIESYTPHGTIFIDGSNIQYPAPEGTRIVIKASRKPLVIFWKR